MKTGVNEREVLCVGSVCGHSIYLAHGRVIYLCCIFMLLRYQIWVHMSAMYTQVVYGTCFQYVLVFKCRGSSPSAPVWCLEVQGIGYIAGK